jgi:hypothetical protein
MNQTTHDHFLKDCNMNEGSCSYSRGKLTLIMWCYEFVTFRIILCIFIMCVFLRVHSQVWLCFYLARVKGVSSWRLYVTQNCVSTLLTFLFVCEWLIWNTSSCSHVGHCTVVLDYHSFVSVAGERLMEWYLYNCRVKSLNTVYGIAVSSY